MVGKGDELTPAEVADELGISTSTVRRYEAKGWLIPRRMPGSRHRRYRRADVDEFIRMCEAGELEQDDIRQPPGRETDPS